MLTFKNFNIADWFSFYRIFAAPFLLIMIWLDLRYVFASLLLISYTTDAIDGYLARRLNITSPRGSQLDSMGDQITFVIGILGLLRFEKDFILQKLTLIIIVTSPYILQMLIAYFKYGKATSFHTYLAKFSAIVQSVFILSALFFEPQNILFFIMIGIGLLETLEEIVLIFMFKFWTSDVKGIIWAINDKRRLRKQNSNN